MQQRGGGRRRFTGGWRAIRDATREEHRECRLAIDCASSLDSAMRVELFTIGDPSLGEAMGTTGKAMTNTSSSHIPRLASRRCSTSRVVDVPDHRVRNTETRSSRLRTEAQPGKATTQTAPCRAGGWGGPRRVRNAGRLTARSRFTLPGRRDRIGAMQLHSGEVAQNARSVRPPQLRRAASLIG